MSDRNWMFVFACITLFFCVMTWFAWFGVFRRMAARNWQRTQGKVISSFVRTGDPDERFVTYEYSVNGKLYRSDRGTPDSKSMEADWREPERYKKDDIVDVFYDTRNPTLCALEKTSVLDMAIVAIFVTVITLWLVAVWIGWATK